MSPRLRLTLLLALVGPLAPAASVQAQTPSAAPLAGPTSYDAVSIHEHDPGDNNRRFRMLPDGITLIDAPLQLLASMAYGVKLDLVSGGPAWVTGKGFDLTAKVLPGQDGKPPALTEPQRSLLLRALLADRFHLQAHVETRTLPVYDLVLAKGGTKMKSAPPPPPPPDSPTVLPDLSKKPRGLAEFGPGFFRATSVPVSELLDQLGVIVGKTVVDKTGLTGYFDLDLEYAPNTSDQPAHPPASNGAEPRPDLFTALQEQLGLKLVPTRGPVRTLVIEHAELPTPN